MVSAVEVLRGGWRIWRERERGDWKLSTHTHCLSAYLFACLLRCGQHCDGGAGGGCLWTSNTSHTHHHNHPPATTITTTTTSTTITICDHTNCHCHCYCIPTPIATPTAAVNQLVHIPWVLVRGQGELAASGWFSKEVKPEGGAGNDERSKP